MQEGDAEVLLQARPDEADGDPANAGAVFERIPVQIQEDARRLRQTQPK